MCLYYAHERVVHAFILIRIKCSLKYVVHVYSAKMKYIYACTTNCGLCLSLNDNVGRHFDIKIYMNVINIHATFYIINITKLASSGNCVYKR